MKKFFIPLMIIIPLLAGGFLFFAWKTGWGPFQQGIDSPSKTPGVIVSVPEKTRATPALVIATPSLHTSSPSLSSQSILPDTVSIEPSESRNTIRTQHILTISVKGNGGIARVANMEVNIILQGTGVLVSLDKGRITGAQSGIGTTGADGKFNVVITSGLPGRTIIIAHVPSIIDSSKHKAFAIKDWVDSSEKRAPTPGVSPIPMVSPAPISSPSPTLSPTPAVTPTPSPAPIPPPGFDGQIHDIPDPVAPDRPMTYKVTVTNSQAGLVARPVTQVNITVNLDPRFQYETVTGEIELLEKRENDLIFKTVNEIKPGETKSVDIIGRSSINPARMLTTANFSAITDPHLGKGSFVKQSDTTVSK